MEVMADSEEEPQQEQPPHDPSSQEQAELEGPAPTPFDHPLFLPILLFGLSVWFGYDGWFNPAMEEHRTFNQGGFVVLSLATAWFGIKGYREWKEDQEAAKR